MAAAGNCCTAIFFCCAALFTYYTGGRACGNGSVASPGWFRSSAGIARGGASGACDPPPNRGRVMQETTAVPGFKPEFPFMDVPKFEKTASEATAAFREIAEKGIVQAKDTYAKMKTAAEEATGMLEHTYANASKGAADYGLKVIEAARANSNAAFDFATELLGARTMAQMVEISTAHTRKQIESITEQARELSALAQKVATTTAEPIKEGLSSLAKKAA